MIPQSMVVNAYGVGFTQYKFTPTQKQKILKSVPVFLALTKSFLLH